MKKIFLSCVILIAATSVLASGGGELHGPPPTVKYFAVNLALLLGILVYFGRKPVKQLFLDRNADFHKQANEAKKQREDLEKKKQEVERLISKLESSQQESIDKAKFDADKYYDHEIAKANETADRVMADATSSIDSDLKKMSEKLRLEILEASVETVDKDLDKTDMADQQKMNQKFTDRLQGANV